MVSTAPNVKARVYPSTTLTNNNVAGQYGFAAVLLDT
jgi:hypothetical protein